MTVMVTGIGLLLGSLFVRYRDVQPIWEVFSQILFYGSPVLYVAATVPAKYLGWYMLNPVAVLLTETRHAMVDRSAPHPWDLVSLGHLMIPAAMVLGVAILGGWVFSREAPKVAENL
jgi:ABC-2 type transport system permease protein